MTKNNNSPITKKLEAIISQAEQLTESENYGDAIILHNLAIELDPNNATIYCDRAWVYSELEEDEKAISDYTKAIELDPNYTDAYKNLGEFYKNLGEYEKAIANYNKIIELKPNEANGYYLRGIVYSNLQEYETAIIDYNKAIKLDPSFSFTYYSRGIDYNELGEYEKAIADFTQSIKLYPIFGFTYHSRGNAYNELGEYQKAIADYNKAIEIYPNLGYFYYDRGCAYSELEEHEKAMSDYTKAIELEPDNTYYQEALEGAVLLKKQKEDDLNDYWIVDLERLVNTGQLLTNEEQCYELFSHFFPENINPRKAATNLIKKFTVLCEQQQVIPYFCSVFTSLKIYNRDTAIMDACVFDQYEDKEILIVDAMEECYQDYKPPFYFGSDFEIFVRNPISSFSFSSFVIFNEFGLITKNPKTLPQFYSSIPVQITAFDKIFWNGCNYDLLKIAEKDNKLVIVIQPHETFYMGITNMKDDDTFQEREQKKATLMFIYFLLKKYFKIYKECADLPIIRYRSVSLLPLETKEQTSFETIIELLNTTDITIADFDTLLKDIETIPWIF
ncbi:tetratricopeptide repeat protein [Geminocystis sp.]|uniref:tetratricopeptide repeat protein n=1 Tax=Geminocystis sp. TaxID=2664100 RepID=UPI0035948CFE